MCGSGTILTEAAMIASGIPAGYYRQTFGFMNWKDFDRDLWKKVKTWADAGIHEAGGLFMGSDIDIRSIRAAERNIRIAGFEQKIRLEQADFNQLKPPFPGGFIITNPPYGERLAVDDLVAFYQSLGNTFKNSFAGYTAWILGSDPESLKFVGLRPSRRIKVMNGPLECRFVRFDLYEGSKRELKDTLPENPAS
jgi:putative N6-adenine-specific DNA methylase